MTFLRSGPERQRPCRRTTAATFLAVSLVEGRAVVELAPGHALAALEREDVGPVAVHRLAGLLLGHRVVTGDHHLVAVGEEVARLEERELVVLVHILEEALHPLDARPRTEDRKVF